MFDKLENSGKTGAKGGNKKTNSFRNAVAGLTTVASLATGINSAEAVEQKPHHVRTNSEEGRTVGMGMRVPQDEQELADFIAEDKKNHPDFPEHLKKLQDIAYNILFAAQKNNLAKLDELLPKYDAIVSEHKIDMMTQVNEESINILIEDGHIDTAEKILKYVLDKKDRVRLQTKIAMAKHDVKKSGH